MLRIVNCERLETFTNGQTSSMAGVKSDSNKPAALEGQPNKIRAIRKKKVY